MKLLLATAMALCAALMGCGGGGNDFPSTGATPVADLASRSGSGAAPALPGLPTVDATASAPSPAPAENCPLASTSI